MAKVLVDTSVVIDLASGRGEWFERTAATMERLDRDHTFVINPVVYAETSVGFDTIEELEDLVASLELQVEEIPKEALFLAGKTFLDYRRRAGSKQSVLPDFFVGAHAATQGYLLVTRDHSRFETYFPTVQVILP